MQYGNGDLFVIRNMMRRLLPELVFNIAYMKKNPTTSEEVQMLLDGFITGDYYSKDLGMIWNLQNAYKLVNDELGNRTLSHKDLLISIHSSISQGFVRVPGRFRMQDVKLSIVTTYKCMSANLLDAHFDKYFETILSVQDPVRRATFMFCWLNCTKFFLGCNKETALVFSNFLLMESRVGILSVNAGLSKEFNKLLIPMFTSNNWNPMIEFLERDCIMLFDGESFIKNFTRREVTPHPKSNKSLMEW